jgi:hypothetical protein
MKIMVKTDDLSKYHGKGGETKAVDGNRPRAGCASTGPINAGGECRVVVLYLGTRKLRNIE